MERKYLRDLDNTIVEYLTEALLSFDKFEDNSMPVDDRKDLYRLIKLLKAYRDGYNEYTKKIRSKVEADKIKEDMYNEMFDKLKYLLPKLII